MNELTHLNQFDTGIRNSCGQTCCTMLINAYTVDDKSVVELAKPLAMDTHRFTPIHKMLKMLSHYGVPSVNTTELSLETLCELLDTRPVIVLVDYRAFRDNPYRYKFAHFMVAVGYDERGVWMHDPMRKHGPTLFPFEEVEQALDTPSETMNGTNYPRQGIYPVEPFIFPAASVSLDDAADITPEIGV